MFDIKYLVMFFCFVMGGYFGGMFCMGENSFRVGICYMRCGFGRWWRKEIVGRINRRGLDR